MPKTRHTEAEIISVLKQVEAGGKQRKWGGKRECPSTRSMLGKRSTGDGGERDARSEAIAGREWATQEAGGGSESGQGRLAIGDSKKRMELTVMKAAVGQVRQECAFSQRRACGLLSVEVSSYR